LNRAILWAIENTKHACHVCKPKCGKDVKCTLCLAFGTYTFVYQWIFGWHWYCLRRHTDEQPIVSSLHPIEHVCVEPLKNKRLTSQLSFILWYNIVAKYASKVFTVIHGKPYKVQFPRQWLQANEVLVVALLNKFIVAFVVCSALRLPLTCIWYYYYKNPPFFFL